MVRRRWVRRLLFGLGFLLFFAAVVVGYIAIPGKQTLTISPETTLITGPKIGDTKLDYAAALNEMWREGVTLDNNAVVPLVDAIGQQSEGFPENPEFYQELGIPIPAPKSTYYTKWTKDANDKERSDLWEALLLQPWKVNENPEFLEWLEKQKEALRLVEVAANRTQWFCPICASKQGKKIENLIEAPLFGLQPLRYIAQALVLRSFVKLEKGDKNGGWNDLLTVLKLSRVLSKGPFIIGSLVSIALETTATKAIPIFLDRAKLSTEQLDQYLAQVQALPPRASLSTTIKMSEKYFTLSAIVNGVIPHGVESVADGRKTSGTEPEARWFTRSVNWDAGLIEVNKSYDRLIAILAIKDRAEREKESAAFVAELKKYRSGPRESSFFSAEKRGLSICRILVALLMPAIQTVQGAFDRVEQQGRMREVFFALAKYRAEKKVYPQTLAELTPKYIAKVPGDLFHDEAPLTYERHGTGYMLSCVGPKPETPIKFETNPKPKEIDMPFVQPVPKRKNQDPDDD